MVTIEMKDKNFDKLIEMLEDYEADEEYEWYDDDKIKSIKDMINALKGAKNEKGKTICFTESEVKTLQDIIQEAITNETGGYFENTKLVNNLDSIYLKVGIKEEDKYWEE